MAKQKRTRQAAVITLLGFALGLALYSGGALQRLEWISEDWRAQQYRSERPLPDDVAVILVDEPSLRAMDPVVGRWPWPRAVYGEVLEYLALGEPRAVVFDILFSENEQGHGDSDRQFARASAAAGNVYHALQVFNPAGEVQRGARARYQEIARPYPALLDSAAGLGVVNMTPDPDGVYRRGALWYDYRDRRLPALGIAALQAGDRPPPMDRDGRYRINFYGDYHPYSMSGVLASLQRIRQGRLQDLVIDPAEFRDKLVFIGTSAAGIHDLKNTPLSAVLPGVMLHAAIAGNVLSGDFLHGVPRRVTVMLMLLMAAAATLAVLFTRRMALKALLPVALATLFTVVAVSLYRFNLVVDLSAPLASLLLATALSFTWFAATEQREKSRVRTMLSQYVSPAVLKTVVDQHDSHLHAEIGESRNVTLLFSDIRDFTSLSERMDAREVVGILNYYFTEMTEAVFARDGTIDKFIGDAIMAFWGAPLADDGQADKALQAALDMRRRLAGVNRWLTQQGHAAIDIGIGIHSGDAVIGNIGSQKKLDYTAIGDNVNLASRLEGLCKTYGEPVLLSQETRDALQQDIPCKIVDRVRVKGKQQPIMIYAPLQEADEPLARRVAQGFAAYLARDWTRAAECYAGLPACRLQDIFLERCRQYRSVPPPQDWDGAYIMTTK